MDAHAQALRDVNYNYIYPNDVFSFDWKVVKVGDGFKVFYEARQNDAGQALAFSLNMETRASISDKNGSPIPASAPGKSGSLLGSVDFKAAPDQNIIVAKLMISGLKQDLQYTFYKPLPKSNSQYLSVNQRVLFRKFVNPGEAVTFAGFNSNDPVQLSYYSLTFPPAAPAFSNSLAKVSKTLRADSLFTVGSTASVEFNKEGLYLAQQDTASSSGVAFRVENDYPKPGTIENLAGPLIYICTKQEAEKLKQVGNDKKKFDQLILTITGNSDRARTFIRSYYRRVELANQYFSSYKEGWKTDRGMIFIIFGLPEEVYLFDDREVWDYKSTNVKARFQFTKSPTLFDPDNYVLIRDKKFADPWYETIDLWRKARL
jgi:GWxTD domain-containing protein